jgi:[methyl-Co(III) methanol-specific corrinoid protein]:coenzyme M methyltransferase
MDLMDKTGAFFPEAHLNAEKMALLAGAGCSELGFDNVMPLFSVWHESAALGCQVDWGEKHRMPDSQYHLCENIGDEIEIPDNFLMHESCQIPLKAIGILKKRFGRDAAITGKVFGPWTLGYHIYGVENFLIASMLEPDNVKKAMRKLIEVTVAFAKAQIDAGADAICLGDHCTRDLCSPDTYRDFLKEIHHELAERIDCPLILHICGDSSDRIEYIAETGVACFHFDSKVPTETAKSLAGGKLALMGGTSNYAIIRKGSPELIAFDVREKIENKINIIGPECAVPLDAPMENLKILARETKKHRLKKNN